MTPITEQFASWRIRESPRVWVSSAGSSGAGLTALVWLPFGAVVTALVRRLAPPGPRDMR